MCASIGENLYPYLKTSQQNTVRGVSMDSHGLAALEELDVFVLDRLSNAKEHFLAFVAAANTVDRVRKSTFLARVPHLDKVLVWRGKRYRFPSSPKQSAKGMPARVFTPTGCKGVAD
jgi:hypothetical protein